MWDRMLYRTGQTAASAAAHVLFQMDVAWEAALPPGPKIIAPNHPSTTDPFVVTGLLPERMHMLIDDRLFKVPGFGRYLTSVGHVPVVLGQGRAALDAGLRLLQEGRTVAIFPEGAISPLAGGFHAPRAGIGHLALQSGAPVIPVGIYLQRDLIRLTETPIEGKTAVGTWYWHGPYAVTFGAPLTFSGDARDYAQVRAVAEQVMARIRALAAASEIRATASRGGLSPEPAAVPVWRRFFPMG